MSSRDPFAAEALSRLGGAYDLVTPDWRDVLDRAGEASAWSGSGRVRLPRYFAVGFSALLIAAVVAVPAFGVRDQLWHLFSSGEPAPPQVQRNFADLDVGAPPGMAPGAIASESRAVLRKHLEGRDVTLWAAPTQKGGLCTSLEVEGFRTPGGGGGCDSTRALALSPQTLVPGRVASAGKVVEGPFLVSATVLDSAARTVEVVYADGTSRRETLVWVSAPISAGFFIHSVPAQYRAAGRGPVRLLVKDADGNAVREATIPDVLQRASVPDPETGIPVGAVANERRPVIDLSDQGIPAVIWAAPARAGGECYWLSYDGDTAGSVCPTVDSRPEALEVTLQEGPHVALVWGRVDRAIASLDLDYAAGTRETTVPRDGYLLHAYDPDRRLTGVTGRGPLGNEIARRSFREARP